MVDTKVIKIGRSRLLLVYNCLTSKLSDFRLKFFQLSVLTNGAYCGVYLEQLCYAFYTPLNTIFSPKPCFDVGISFFRQTLKLVRPLNTFIIFSASNFSHVVPIDLTCGYQTKLFQNAIVQIVGSIQARLLFSIDLSRDNFLLLAFYSLKTNSDGRPIQCIFYKVES